MRSGGGGGIPSKHSKKLLVVMKGRNSFVINELKVKNALAKISGQFFILGELRLGNSRKDRPKPRRI